MKSQEILLCEIYGILLFIYVAICLLLEYRGKIVEGIIKESVFIPEKNISKVKFDVDGRIIKLRMKGHPEVGTKEKFIKYRWICIFEAIHKIRVRLGVNLFGISGFTCLIFCYDFVEYADLKKIVAIGLWLIMSWGPGYVCLVMSKKVRERIKKIKDSKKYERKQATIIEKRKDGNEHIYIAQFTHNGVIYKKEVWTSALKNNFKIGESVELFLDEEDIISDVYITLGKRDNGKEKLLVFMALSLFVMGVIGALLVYINN